jgi:hypothetical protein
MPGAAHSSARLIVNSRLCGLAEYEDVFVGDDPQWEPVGAGLADLVQLKEGRTGHQPVLA